MKSKIKQAFAEIKAEKSLKSQTYHLVAKKMHHSVVSRRRAILLRPVIACAMLLFVLAGGYFLYFMPMAVICIDVNPSLELTVNQLEQVISVKAYNEDGEQLANSAEIQFLHYTQAVEQLLSSGEMEQYLQEDSVVSIGVIGDNHQKDQQILGVLQSCTANHQNAYCYLASKNEVAEAHSLGLSYGKYRAFLQLQSIDPTITPEQVAQMTMAEIHSLMETLSGQTNGFCGQWGKRKGQNSCNSAACDNS